jgi:hypothetical protein
MADEHTREVTNLTGVLCWSYRAGGLVWKEARDCSAAGELSQSGGGNSRRGTGNTG